MIRDGACLICGQAENELTPDCPRTRDWTIPTRDSGLTLPPSPRSLRVHVDRCRGCCFCGNASVPRLRLCRHPALKRPLPITETELDAPQSPSWCPARGCVVLAAGLARGSAEEAPAPARSDPPPETSDDARRAGYSVSYGPDASPSAVRHVAVGSVAACDRSMLLTGVEPAAEIPKRLRCRRGPCRVAWEEVAP